MLLDLEVSCERTQELRVGQAFLLEEQVQVLSFAGGLVERELLDQEILLADLDVTIELREIEKTSARQGGLYAEGIGWMVRSQGSPSSCSGSGESSRRSSSCASSMIESTLSAEAASRTSSATRMGTSWATPSAIASEGREST